MSKKEVMVTDFIKKRWPKDYKEHSSKSDIEKWESRMDMILMGFFYKFKLFDNKSRKAFYYVLHKHGHHERAKKLANYMRGEANKERALKRK